MRLIPVFPGSPKLQSYPLHSSDRPRPLHVSVSFPFSLLLFCFFVWYSHIESARFVIVYHSCVPVHTTKRSMSRLTQPITPTDFFITENCLLYFYNFFMIVLGINRSKIELCEYQLATHTLSLTRTHTLNPHVYILTYVCIIMYMYLFCLICIYMNIQMCTCSYRLCLALKTLKTWLVGFGQCILRLTTWFKESFTYVNLTLMMG